MLKKKNKNLFVVKTRAGKILYRVEGDGYCFYEGKTMKFYFLDMITGTFYLNYLGAISRKRIGLILKNVLGYEIEPSVFDDVQKQYMESAPQALLSA